MQDANSMFVSASDSIKIWDADGVKVLKQYNGENLSSGSNFKDVVWNNSNTLIASASNGNGVVLWDCSSAGGHEIRELSKSKEQTSVCFCDSKLFSGSATGDISMWDIDSGKCRKTFDSGHKSPIRRLDKIGGGGRIVSACNSGEIIIWLVETGVPLTRLKTSKSKSVRGLEHSPWERTILGTTFDDGAVCVWDTEKRATKYSFTSHDAPAMDLSFSPLNHLLLASCGLDKKLVFYDIQGNNVVKTITSTQPLTAVCFLSNGVHVCAGTSMGNIYKYDLRKTEEPLNSIHAHSTSVQRLVLQTLKEKTLRKERKSSRTESAIASNQQKVLHGQEELKPPTHPTGKSKVVLRTSQDLTKNRRSWTKVPEVELPVQDSKMVNGEPSPSRSIPNRKSHLEKSLGLQTPLNRSNASSRRDTLGSYCEGIFSPVASMNESVHGETYVPQSQSNTQRTRGEVPQNTNPYSSFNFNTNVIQNVTGRSLRDRHSYINGDMEGKYDGGDSVSVTDNLTNSTVSFSQVQNSTPANPTTVSTSSLSPRSESIAERLHQETDDTSLNTLVNGNIMGPSSAGLQQPNVPRSNPFQYQLDFLQNTVRELVEEHEDNIRDELRHLHMQIIKMFAEQNERIRQLAEQCSVNPLLLQEIERLRTENDRLRRKF